MKTIQLRVKGPLFDVVFQVVVDGEAGKITSNLSDGEPADLEAGLVYRGAVDGVEAMVLGHACAGVDVTDSKYVEGLTSAVEGILNHLGD